MTESSAGNAAGDLDPVDYAVISQGIQAAAREMGVKLIRSAYSTILREARDGSAALLDARGREGAELEIDGGVKVHNARTIARAGASVLVAGSAVFNDKASVAANIAAFREQLS